METGKTYLGEGGWIIRQHVETRNGTVKNAGTFYHCCSPKENAIANSMNTLKAAKQWCIELTKHIGSVIDLDNATIVERVRAAGNDVVGWIKDYRHDEIDAFSVADFKAGLTRGPAFNAGRLRQQLKGVIS